MSILFKSKSQNSFLSSKGYSLIELVLIVLIIGGMMWIVLPKIQNSRNGKGSKVKSDTLATSDKIQASGERTLHLKRSDLAKYLNNLADVFEQSRARLNRVSSTGEINGYFLVDYQPGSIFELMGLPRETLIKSADGEPVDSIQSVMEIFKKLRHEKKFTLDVRINGSDQKIKYEIQ